MGDRSDRSEAQSPAPSVIRDEEEHDLSDENVSEVDEREYKDEGINNKWFSIMQILSYK